MLVVRFAVGDRARGMSFFGETGGRRAADDAKNRMKLRKFKGDDRVNTGA